MTRLVQLFNNTVEKRGESLKGVAVREWVLAETNYGIVKDNPYEVAVLPMGATEPHNIHLPYGTDTLESEAIASRACEGGPAGSRRHQAGAASGVRVEAG